MEFAVGKPGAEVGTRLRVNSRSACCCYKSCCRSGRAGRSLEAPRNCKNDQPQPQEPSPGLPAGAAAALHSLPSTKQPGLLPLLQQSAPASAGHHGLYRAALQRSLRHQCDHFPYPPWIESLCKS